jgi:hypothetical protein
MERDPGGPALSRRCCRYCQQSFEPSKFRRDQSVCFQPECQRRRRTDYHRGKIAADSEYAQIVRDSRRKWRQTHPGYQKRYRQSHAATVERNRQLQQRRDEKRRIQLLVKNNLALDLKRCDAAAWLVGSPPGDLVRNNLASCRMFIFQPVAPVAALPAAS